MVTLSIFSFKLCNLASLENTQHICKDIKIDLNIIQLASNCETKRIGV